MSLKSKSALYSLAVISLIFAAARLYYLLTDDFRLGNITYEQPYRQEWDIPPPPPKDQKKIDDALKQEFSYLGKGAQSYAFVSADGQYVLKFFKFKHLRPMALHAWLPLIEPLESYQLKQVARKQRKLEGVFEGYRLAYECHRDESGLLLIHLNRTDHSFGTIVLADKIGLYHRIDLDELPFVLQYKVQTFRQVVQQLLTKGDIKGCKEKIAAVFSLYLQEYAKGIVDHDHGVMRNIGFLGNKAVHLDVGKLHAENTIRQRREQARDLALMCQRMKGWLKANAPEGSTLSSYIDELYQRALYAETDSKFGFWQRENPYDQTIEMGPIL